MNKKFKILWIEDECNMINSLVRPLIKDGHEVIIAEDEKEALQKLNETTFDLILCDIIIPSGEKGGVEINTFIGLRLLEKILIEMKLSIPVIVISVVRDPHIISKAKQIGVKKFLNKGTLLPSMLKNEVYYTLGIFSGILSDE